MPNALKYITDKNGYATAVVVPIKAGKKINSDYSKLQNKLKILTSIKEGIEEVKQAKKSGKKLQSLKEFLDEC